MDLTPRFGRIFTTRTEVYVCVLWLFVLDIMWKRVVILETGLLEKTNAARCRVENER